ncbi:MAG: calcium-binding protein [Pseudomonadota bacterium]
MRKTIRGSDKADVLQASKRQPNIDAGGGNDVLEGDRRANRLEGGDGNDRIKAGSGKDVVDGGNGNDVLRGNGGNDRIEGGRGNDNMFGGTGKDNLDGGKGRDDLDGGRGDDKLFGGAGRDNIFAGQGKDVAEGGAGADAFLFAVREDSDGDEDQLRIKDFEVGKDRIGLLDADEQGRAGFDSILVDEVNGNAVIRLFDDDNENGTEEDGAIYLVGVSREEVLNNLDAIFGAGASEADNIF